MQLPTALFQDFFWSASSDATALFDSYNKIKARKALLYHIPNQDLKIQLKRYYLVTLEIETWARH